MQRKDARHTEYGMDHWHSHQVRSFYVCVLVAAGGGDRQVAFFACWSDVPRSLVNTATIESISFSC